MNDELKIETRNLLDHLRMMVAILIVDRNNTLAIELKDDTKTSSYDAIGSAIYSTNKSLSISYVSIFESIWKEAELYAKIKALENQIKVQTNADKSITVATILVRLHTVVASVALFLVNAAIVLLSFFKRLNLIVNAISVFS